MPTFHFYTQSVVQGWLNPLTLRGHHYFVNGLSNCGRYRIPNYKPMFTVGLPKDAAICERCHGLMVQS